MTSNVGADLIRKETSIGFVSRDDALATYDRMKNRVLDEVKKTFRPEFLNRIDEVIVFRPLSKEDLGQIVDIMLGDLNRRLAEKDLALSFNKKVKTFLADKGYDPKYGARPLRRTIEDYIEDPLSEDVLRGKFRSGMEIKSELKAEKITFTGKKTRKANALKS